MAKPFSMSLVADVSQFIRDTGRAVDQLETVIEGLEEIGSTADDSASNAEESLRGIGTEAGKAADDVKAAGDAMGDGFDGVDDAAKTAGDAIGDEFKAGADKAHDEVKSAAGKIGGELKTAGGEAKGAGDEIGSEIKAGSDKAAEAAEKLRTRAATALDRLKTKARSTGKDVGDDLKAGTAKAGEGFEELGDEAGQAGKEAATSFTGEFEDITDLIRDITVEAFNGFGPAGVAAGIAAAAGIGLAVAALQKAEEKADDTREAIWDLADELAEVEGNEKLIDWSNRFRESLSRVTDNKSWFEPWQDADVTALDQVVDATDRLGISLEALGAAVSDADAYQAFSDNLADTRGALEDSLKGLHPASQEFQEIIQQMYAVDALQQWVDSERKLLGEAGETHEAYAAVVAGAHDDVRAAELYSAESHEEYAGGVESALSKAGEAWEEYTQDGILNLEEYNKAIEEQYQAVQDFERNMVLASSQLSSEALSYIRSLGPEAAPLLQAFIDAPLKERQRTARNWDLIGSTSSTGYEAGFDKGTPARLVTEAMARARAVADRQAPIKVPTTVSTSDLQRQVNWAAAAVRPPILRYGTSVGRLVD